MKELVITRTVKCPREQTVEKEIWGDTVKQRKTYWPLDVFICIRCDHHITINYATDGKPPTVMCDYDN